LKRLVATLLLFTLVLTGVQAQDERLQIVASFSILADVASNVAGDAADVTSLIPIGADPHSFTPSPRDIAAIADADVVFINGMNFEELLMEGIENAGGEANIVTVSWCIEVLESGGHAHEEEGEAEADHEEGEVAMNENIDAAIAERCAAHTAERGEGHEDHATEEASVTEEADHDHAHGEKLGALYEIECGGHEEEAAEGEEHAHGACDAHVWTDPHNVVYWTLYIRDTLIELDAANAETYTQNAAAYIEQLETLIHDELEPMLLSVPEEQRILVTNHETLGYLAAAYGYEVVGTVIPGAGTAAEPSAADIAALIDLVREEGVTAVFAENTVNASIAEQVAAESGATFHTLLSDSLSGEDGEGTTYIDYMRYNVSVIVEALGG
jgi:ABC-type Zn uptake system ZnuABC Zn-binding protein ZnuA